MNNLEELKKDLHSLDDEIGVLNKKRYRINEEYVKQLKKECEKNIGKCYRRTVSLDSRSIDRGEAIYYIITNTQEIQYKMVGGSHFNQYQYEVLKFEYPYNGENIPFKEDDEHIGNLEKYEKISKEEFLKAYQEINDKWIDKLFK